MRLQLFPLECARLVLLGLKLAGPLADEIKCFVNRDKNCLPSQYLMSNLGATRVLRTINCRFSLE